MDMCKTAIVEVLHNIHPDDVIKVAKFLVDEIGVESTCDLSLVQAKDLDRVLKPIQARKLVQAWIVTKSDQQSFICGTNRASSSLSSSPVSDCDEFNVPWEKISPHFIRICDKNLIPDPTQRREMIRVVVDAILERYPQPSMRLLRKVAASIVDKYPQSFLDKTNGCILRDGYGTLLNQLFNRKETVLRRKRQLGYQSLPKRLKQDYHEMVESIDEREAKRSKDKLKFLKIESTKVIPDAQAVKDAMHDTYHAQRSVIDLNPSVNTLLQEIPFLFHLDYMAAHYQRLTGNYTDIVQTYQLRMPHIYRQEELVCNLLSHL